MPARHQPLGFVMLVLALFAVSCAGSDPTSIAAGALDDAPPATTPPMALPLSSPTAQESPATPEPAAPTVVVEDPTPESAVPTVVVEDPTPESAVPTVVVEDPTPESVAPTVVVEDPTPESVAPTVVVEDPTPESVAPTVVVEDPTPAPTEAPASDPGGARISLVDVPVVNLLTGGTTSLGDLSPSGATLLFFWAPH